MRGGVAALAAVVGGLASPAVTPVTNAVSETTTAVTQPVQAASRTATIGSTSVTSGVVAQAPAETSGPTVGYEPAGPAPHTGARAVPRRHSAASSSSSTSSI